MPIYCTSEGFKLPTQTCQRLHLRFEQAMISYGCKALTVQLLLMEGYGEWSTVTMEICLGTPMCTSGSKNQQANK